MSASITLTLPDGSQRSYPSGVTGMGVAESISEGLARKVIAAEVAGQIWDLARPITQDAPIRLLTWDDDGGKNTFWHSSAHILAEAIEFFYPNAKLTIGPPIENGFYYDIDFGQEHFSQPDFEKIEQKFLELAQSGETFERREISKADAIAFYRERNNPYKLELIEGLTDGDITFYHSGNFVDLCRGPHVPNSKMIKAVKVLNTAGAYWRGDEKRPMLTRVYGISFPKKSELDEYLVRLEEAKKRDHRKLGQELELFTFSQRVGPGLPLWLPKGAQLREELERFMRRLQVEAGYLPVITPHIGKKELYVCSGHYDKYGKDSFQPIHTPDVDEEFLLKPMNCPHHCEIYASRPRSYRELPLRLAEFGTVYRYEMSGELHGLTRVRGFTQDDAHIFCTPEQVKDEFKKVIEIVLYVFRVFGFEDYTAQISLRDPDNKAKYIGEDANWDLAEQQIYEAAQEMGLRTVSVTGEAAFYGPKLDFMIKDALGRKWQLGTVQVDYNLPARFELTYTGADNQPHQPVMIHRAPFGSLERFVAVLLEHTGGNLPLWLAPTQAVVLTISDKFNEYAHQVSQKLQGAGLRISVDERSEKIGRKIRDAEVSKVPYMLVVGEKEQADQKVALRRHGEGDIGTFTLAEAQALLEKAIAETLNPTT